MSTGVVAASSYVSASGYDAGSAAISVRNVSVCTFPIFVAGAMSSSEVAAVKKVIWSEVLTNVNFYRENSNAMLCVKYMALSFSRLVTSLMGSD